MLEKFPKIMEKILSNCQKSFLRDFLNWIYKELPKDFSKVMSRKVLKKCGTNSQIEKFSIEIKINYRKSFNKFAEKNSKGVSEQNSMELP